MAILGKNYIGFQNTSEGTKSFQSYVPTTGTYLTESFSVATTDEVEKAMKLAASAAPILATKTPSEKAAFLYAICEEITNLGDELLERAHLETALPLARLQGERGRTINQLTQFAQLLEEGSWVDASIDTALPDRQPLPKPDIRKMYVPLGTVVVFGSSNFPFAYSVAGVDTGPAFAAGCPVVVKAHAAHPGTSDLTAQAIIKAAKRSNMPEGTFSMLYDDGFEVGEALVKHPIAKAVGFTGSYNGGMALYKMANDRKEPIPVFAEMGSVNPVVLLPETLSKNPSGLGQTLAGSVTLGTGQFCTNPGLVFTITNDAISTFETAYKNAIEKIAPTTMLTAGIANNFKRLTSEAKAQENTEVLGESTLSSDNTNLAYPTILKTTGKTFIDNPVLHEEVFGPFSILVVCSDEAELNAALNKCTGQLTVSIFGDVDEIKLYSETVGILKQKAGRFIINGVPTGVEVCPSMHHGGPFPAATDSRFTSVGRHAILRFVRPQSYQDWPNSLLPAELQNENPLKINRLVNNIWTTEPI